MLSSHDISPDLVHVLEHGPPIFIKNEKGEYVYANVAFCEILGNIDILGKTDADLPWGASGHGKTIFQADDKAVMENKVVRSKSEKIVIKEKAYYFWLTKTPWLDQAGRVQGVIGYLANITALKQQMRAQGESDRLRDYKYSIFENISERMLHNWRSPALDLFALNGAFKDAVKAKDSDTLIKLTRQHEQSSKANLHNINNFIQELDRCNRPEAVHADDIFISSLLDGINTLMQPYAQEKLLSLRFYEHQGQECIKTDAYRIEGALEEIVHNAIDFTQSGSITVDSRIVTNTNAKTRIDSPYLLEISVTDSGVGIAQEDLERIFSPCVYLGKGHAHDDAHMGNGLTRAKALLKALEGKITVSSTLEKGSTFTLAIPVGEPTVGSMPFGEKVLSEHLKVLLVEDNEMCAKMASIFVKNQGGEAIWVKDGDAALMEIEQSDFDLVLMDINLGKDKDTGDIVTQKIREWEASKNIREENGLCIVGLSAQLDVSSKITYLQQGMQEAFPKPLDDVKWAKIQLIIKRRLQRDTVYDRERDVE